MAEWLMRKPGIIEDSFWKESPFGLVSDSRKLVAARPPEFEASGFKGS